NRLVQRCQQQHEGQRGENSEPVAIAGVTSQVVGADTLHALNLPNFLLRFSKSLKPRRPCEEHLSSRKMPVVYCGGRDNGSQTAPLTERIQERSSNRLGTSRRRRDYILRRGGPAKAFFVLSTPQKQHTAQ